MESYSTADATKQVTVAYDFDSSSMDQPQGQATIQLQNDAFCGVK